MKILIATRDQITARRIQRAIMKDYIKTMRDVFGNPASVMASGWETTAGDVRSLLGIEAIDTLVIDTSVMSEIGIGVLQIAAQKGINIIPATVLGSTPEDQWLNLSTGGGNNFIQY